MHIGGNHKEQKEKSTTAEPQDIELDSNGSDDDDDKVCDSPTIDDLHSIHNEYIQRLTMRAKDSLFAYNEEDGQKEAPADSKMVDVIDLATNDSDEGEDDDEVCITICV